MARRLAAQGRDRVHRRARRTGRPREGRSEARRVQARSLFRRHCGLFKLRASWVSGGLSRRWWVLKRKPFPVLRRRSFDSSFPSE